MDHSARDVLVIGGGLSGLVAAWRALESGARVTVLDPAPGDGATHAAAGMLAPVGEACFGESGLAWLGTASLPLWPEFAETLERAAGLPAGAVGLDRTGTLVVAYDGDDLVALRRLLALHEEWGLSSVEISADEARAREPAVGPRIRGAAWVPGDHQADPRAVHAALVAALAPEVTVVRRAAVSLTWSDGAVVGALDDAGRRHAADVVVLAAGHASGELYPGAPTRPVPGTTLRLDVGPELTGGVVVRGTVQGRPVYVVPRPPRADGRREVVVGATSDERDDDRLTRAGGVFALLRDARALLPALDDAVFVEATTRSRPASPDNAPLLGRAADGLLLATGHHRNGVLLAPLTAAVIDAALGAASDGVPPTDPTARAVAVAARFADPRRYGTPVPEQTQPPTQPPTRGAVR